MTTMLNPQQGHLPELPSAEPMLFQQSVPPRLVRRTNSPDVFVTDLQVTGYNTFRVGVRWPASHSFYGPVTQRSHDPLLFLECVRQAGLLVAHVAFGIATEAKFITHDKEFNLSADGLRAGGAEPVDVAITVTAHDIRRRGRGFAGARFEFTGERDGQRIGTAAYRWSCASPAAYQRLRGEYRTAQPPVRDGLALVRPDLVGRTDRIDVMLTERRADGAWGLSIDPTHPVIFDHPIDHVPGNGVIEVARQAALLEVGVPTALPISGWFAFAHYIEFDETCLVFAERVNGGDEHLTTVRITMEQHGRTAGNGSLDLLTAI